MTNINLTNLWYQYINDPNVNMWYNFEWTIEIIDIISISHIYYVNVDN
jgi:hypothetical protein